MVTFDERQAFSDRLNLVLDEEGLPPKGSGRQNQLAKDWGLSQKGVRKWLEGEGVPETTRLIEMAKRYGVSFEWLATGRNPSTLQSSTSVVRRAEVAAVSGRNVPSEISAVAGHLIDAIVRADIQGMPDRAFMVLHETLKTFDDFLGLPSDALLDLNAPGPEEG
ncbi:helix-turn-helix transcriptional regulator [Burkholderia vietnamiensis]|jgi:transcriptional regulator with XRE-family HTH domain|uniref:helix-turn-helix domain-containing protein n=1 Tax=Burkholderia vietnamiensis TaxID=60552 RepID=UPI001B95FD24|nr:helix-turn-helix transcriptional regulator [Burkholderia vietnamiensis]MBR8084532.1 helix-turn-helix transcriptional regulator [Burkholderia vietnamiensis]